MKIFLWWGKESGANSEPYTSDIGAPPGDTCYIASLLTDDGGFGYKKTIRESEQVLEAIKEIRAGCKENFSWSRENFLSEISRDNVKISSQYMEEYYDTMKLDEFEYVLLTWRQMLVAGPEAYSSKIEIEIHPFLNRP